MAGALGGTSDVRTSKYAASAKVARKRSHIPPGFSPPSLGRLLWGDFLRYYRTDEAVPHKRPRVAELATKNIAPANIALNSLQRDGRKMDSADTTIAGDNGAPRLNHSFCPPGLMKFRGNILLPIKYIRVSPGDKYSLARLTIPAARRPGRLPNVPTLNA